MLLVSVLLACGDAPNPTLRPTSSDGSTVTVQSSATISRPEVPGEIVLFGSKTAVPFFSPSAGATIPKGTYILAFDRKPGGLILEASVTVPRPEGLPSDWQLQIGSDGVAKYTRNPRSKTNAQTTEHYLSPEKQDALLAQLGKLGVLDLPDTTPPGKASAGGVSRGLSLSLQGRPKLITDLTGSTSDGLNLILNLIRQTVEAAPPRNSP